MKKSSLWIGLCVVVFASPLSAQMDKAATKEFCDELIFPLSDAPGMMIAVVSGNDTLLIPHGEVRRGSGKKPDGKTIWMIGSATKALTGNILGSMVADGSVKLTDPVSKFLPPGTKLPSRDGQAIRLVDLATHTSALPRAPEFMNDPKKYPPTDPWANVTEKDVYAWLANYKLPGTPGRHYAYSNVGFGLLGDVLAKHKGVSFDGLVGIYLRDRLGMKDTGIALNDEQKTRLATCYGTDSKEAREWRQTQITQASGALYCTADDMVKLMRANMGIATPGYDDVRLLTLAGYVPRNMMSNEIEFGEGAMALGWEVDYPENGLPMILHKNGWTSGFNCWVFLVPSEQIGIVIFSNKPYLWWGDPARFLIRSLIEQKRAARR